MSCPDCFSGAIREGKPTGREETLYGIRTYIADGQPNSQAQNASSASTATSKATIVFITDAFGVNLVNSKLLADIYAKETGFRVLVPDVIPGGGVPTYALELIETAQTPVAWTDLAGQWKRLVSIVHMVSLFLPFAIRTRNAFPGILAYARSVRQDMPAGTKLGAAGFCWGGMQTAKLTMESATDGGEEKLVDAHFMGHPSGLKVPDDIINSVREVPCSIALGETDTFLPKPRAEELEARLRTELAGREGSQYEIKIYEKCGHGFALRADSRKAVEDQGAEETAKQAVAWFKQHLS